MSKFLQIQNELRSLDGGRYQTLCDAYLHARGYAQINRFGSVIGKDKTKTGTPDSYVALPNGKYVFAEYTTQTNDFADKLSKDLDKCFDPGKIGISVDRIEEIVLCYLGELNPSEQNILVERCQQQSCRLTLIGIGQMSLDLYQKYPHIARDFLGVELDSGQILSLDDFVLTYGRNRLAAPLDLQFHFRESELNQASQALDAHDLLIVSGAAGVGKTRFALECCRQFLAKHAEHQIYEFAIVKVIQPRG